MPRKLDVVLDPTQLEEPVVWEGWGTSLAWFAVALGSDSVLRECISTLLFSKDPKNGLGMNIVRYNIGGSCPKQAEDYRAGAAVPCPRHPDGSSEWDADCSQVAMLLEAARLGADTFEAFVNSPPWFWTSSGSSRGHELPLANNLKKQHIKDFAAFCAEVVNHFAQEHGIVFGSLSPFNEPSSPAWSLKMSNRQEGCYFSRGRAIKVLRALAQQTTLVANGTQLVAFEQFCLRDTLSDLDHLPEDLWPHLHRINLHTYTSKHFLPGVVRPLVVWQDNPLWRMRVRKLAQKHHKKVWVSEFGSGRGPLAIAKQIIRDIAQLRVSAWVYWQAVEAPGVGWGLLEAPLEGQDAAVAIGTGDAADSTCSTTLAALVAGDSRSSVAEHAQPAAAASNHSAQGTIHSSNGLHQQQQKACAVQLHPNYFVLRFIMQCIPVGASVFRLKKLGKCGVLVQHSHQHWVLLYVNTSNKQQALQLDAAALLTPAANGQTRSTGVSKQMISSSAEQYGATHAGSAAATAATAPAGSAVTADTMSALSRNRCAAPASQLSRLGTINVQTAMLDISHLQSVPWIPGSVDSPRGLLVDDLSKGVHCNGWPVSVHVPCHHLCRIDVLLV